MIFGSLNNCYVNGFSNITLTSTAANASDYNNLMGKIRVTASGTYYSLADHQINFPTLNVHSFNLPPLFNDSTKEDFTLQAGSPHLNAAFVGSSGALSTTTGYNIGGTAYAKPFHVTGASEWQVSNGAIWENVTQQGTDIVVTAGNPYGRITSAPLLISSNPVMLGNINYFGLQLFNKSKAGGSDTNKSVPDANMYTGSDPSGGGNPDRLTLEMRFVSTDAKPQAENDWNNGYLLPSGAFGKFVINAQPFVDNSQKGNGEPDYAVTVTNVVVATWVQLRITLRNDYQ